MPPVIGIFIVSDLRGEAGTIVRDIQLEFDKKLAAQNPPHVTIVGSSGVGPIPPKTSVEHIRELLEPIARDTPPLTLPFGDPMRFMQTDIVVLPLDPHGPLRVLHDRIASSGLKFARPRFTFSPHVTLTFYRTLTNAQRAKLLSLRVTAPAILDELVISLTRDPLPAKTLLRLPLSGSPSRTT